MRYGLPGIASEIHSYQRVLAKSRGYGLPGIASEIHYIEKVGNLFLAMVCRESLLRYTLDPQEGTGRTAMVCRESLLRYTGRLAKRGPRRAMVCRESLLRYTHRRQQDE